MRKRTPLRAPKTKRATKPPRARRPRSAPTAAAPSSDAPPLLEREHYDFTADDVVEQLARLSRLGASELAIANSFGYLTAGGLRRELAKPGHERAVRALRQGKVALELEMLGHVLGIARNPLSKSQFNACKWLVENRCAPADEDADLEPQDEGTLEHSPGFVTELRGQVH